MSNDNEEELYFSWLTSNASYMRELAKRMDAIIMGESYSRRKVNPPTIKELTNWHPSPIPDTLREWVEGGK